MISSRLLLTAGLVLVLAAGASAAQVTTGKPIKVQGLKAETKKLKCEVLLMTRAAVTVRHLDNYNRLQTFTFDGKLAGKMAKLVDEDKGYRHGDRIEITYLAGSERALKIKGKPRQKR
ncbi:MAG: hypothetical protein ACE5HB_08325 [Terriglobia bacterium]